MKFSQKEIDVRVKAQKFDADRGLYRLTKLTALRKSRIKQII